MSIGKLTSGGGTLFRPSGTRAPGALLYGAGCWLFIVFGCRPLGHREFPWGSACPGFHFNPLKKLIGGDRKAGRELDQRVDARRAEASLQLADLGAVNRGAICHLVLGDSYLPAAATEVLAEAGCDLKREPPLSDGLPKFFLFLAAANIDQCRDDHTAAAGVAALDHPAGAELARQPGPRHRGPAAPRRLVWARSPGYFDQAAGPGPKRPGVLGIGHRELDPRRVTGSPHGPRASCGSALSLPVRTTWLISGGVETGTDARRPFPDRFTQPLTLPSPPIA